MTPEELLLRSLAAYLDNDSLSTDITKESFWHDLIALAQEQKLLPVLFDVLHESMPESIFDKYRQTAVLQVARQTAHTMEFLQLYKELSNRCIPTLVVKGIIARSTYSRSDLRISADEDLYIARSDYLVFHQAMKELGFDCVSMPDLNNAHEERYYRHDFLIEGHWELFPQEHALLNSLNRYSKIFWDRAQPVIIDGIPILTLEPTDHMVFLLLHAFKHFIGSGFGIRQIADIAQWSKTYEIDWDRAHCILSEAHADYFASAIFGIGEEYFGMVFPQRWVRTNYELLLSDALSAGIYGSSTMSRKHSSTMTLGAVESKFHGTHKLPLLSSLFPNRSVMEMSFPWVKHSIFLLPAAWGLRIFRYLSSRGEGNSSAEALRIGNERIELLKYYKII